MTLTACSPSAFVDHVPLSGKITVEYVGMSPPDGEVMFTLTNGTTQAIHFLGTPDPYLGKLHMFCDLGHEAVAYGQGVTEPAQKYKTMKVKSGERWHLNLRNSQFGPVVKNHNSRCHLSLKLEDGAVVDSSEFYP